MFISPRPYSECAQSAGAHPQCPATQKLCCQSTSALTANSWLVALGTPQSGFGTLAHSFQPIPVRCALHIAPLIASSMTTYRTIHTLLARVIPVGTVAWNAVYLALSVVIAWDCTKVYEERHFCKGLGTFSAIWFIEKAWMMTNKYAWSCKSLQFLEMAVHDLAIVIVTLTCCPRPAPCVTASLQDLLFALWCFSCGEQCLVLSVCKGTSLVD